MCQCVKGHGGGQVLAKPRAKLSFFFFYLSFNAHSLVLIFDKEKSTFIWSWASARCDVRGSGLSRSVQEEGGRGGGFVSRPTGGIPSSSS